MNEQYIEWMRRLNDEIGRVSGISSEMMAEENIQRATASNNLELEYRGGFFYPPSTDLRQRDDALGEIINQRRVNPGWRQIASESNTEEVSELTVETMTEWLTELFTNDEVFKDKEILPNGYGHEVKKVDIF